MDLASELRAVVGALTAHEIPYALVGGLAVAVWGAPRATKDIDLLIRPESLAGAKSVLAQVGYTLEAGLMDFSDGMTMARVNKVKDGDLMTVDLLFVNENLREAWEGRATRMFGDVPLVVVSREGLLQMKMQSGRPQDRMDVIKLSEMDR
ncbi:MAG: nucleotidyltransferase family protein [Myxococcales bacterium]|nr:nucleotidyltransferase family protein [Myxococcales bacterium]